LGNVEQIRIAACRKKRAVEITLNRLCPAIAEHWERAIVRWKIP
jgi:hypothetical protein